MIDNKRSLNNQTIYQVFVRQFSSTHDFNGVAKQLDRIKALGTDILYLLPFYPIGKKNRKGSVGSPYSIYDYTEIDPANGTLDDFKNLLRLAHEKGMKVIIDMVLNHTSRDSVLLQQHEEWFYHADGKPANKVGDWSDVCDLDYSHKALCERITDILCYWVKLGVDGFRMDVCSLVPAHFWAQAVDALHKLDPQLIMLGESISADFVRAIRRVGCDAMSDGEAYNYFDMLYCYDIQDAQGPFFQKNGGTLGAWLNAVLDQEGRYPSDFVKARYLDNHDLPRIASTWHGDKLKMLWALNFYLKGAAFVYAGDETSFDRQNSLFEYDEVAWSFGDEQKDISAYISNLAAVKKHEIYSQGYFDINMQGENAAVCSYESATALSVGVFNFADKAIDVKVSVPDGTYENLVTHKQIVVRGGMLTVGNDAVIIELKK
ncbi:MAG: alpha-amylase [Clostridiales bacterium]|nr:alpha-amylase [Clostridiales bacterium]